MAPETYPLPTEGEVTLLDLTTPEGEAVGTLAYSDTGLTWEFADTDDESAQAHGVEILQYLHENKAQGTPIDEVITGIKAVYVGDYVESTGDFLSDPDAEFAAFLDQFVTTDDLGDFGKHDLIFYENRRTPEVVAKGAKGKKGGAGTAAGKVVKRRPATKDEERTIANGGWVRVAKDGSKPGDAGYKKNKGTHD